MSVPILVKRGSRAAINAAAAASGLKAGETYLITDENRLAVGLSVSTYEAFVKQSEVDTGGSVDYGLITSSPTSTDEYGSIV